jgi:hypothetical protein
MSICSIVIGQVRKSVPNTAPTAAEVITTSGTSQQSSNSVPAADDNEYWIITVSGGDLWVKFGADPTAAAGDEWLVTDGQTREWKALSGDKVAVINA